MPDLNQISTAVEYRHQFKKGSGMRKKMNGIVHSPSESGEYKCCPGVYCSHAQKVLDIAKNHPNRQT
jgi:hypothetical protein